MLSFFPRDVLDENWDLIESVSEAFPTYSFVLAQLSKCVLTCSILVVMSLIFVDYDLSHVFAGLLFRLYTFTTHRIDNHVNNIFTSHVIIVSTSIVLPHLNLNCSHSIKIIQNPQLDLLQRDTFGLC